MVEKIAQLDRNKVIFWSLLGTLFLCAGLYIYCVTATIHNVVARQNIEAKAASLSLALGKEEFQYISMKNAISLPLAYSLGFHSVSDESYVSRDSRSFVSYVGKGI